MLTAPEMQAALNFWDWFKKNHLPFEFMDDMEPEQWEDLHQTLLGLASAYSEGIQIEIGKHMSDTGPEFRIVVSANGVVKFFEKAKTLAQMSPDIPNWVVMGLLPPLPKGVNIRFQLENGVLAPDEMWYILMDSPDEPQFLGIHIGLKMFDQFEEDKQEDLTDVVMQMVANIIGEESWGLNVQHLQIGPLPLDPEGEGFLPMYDLPESIAEFRKERPSPRLEELE